MNLMKTNLSGLYVVEPKIYGDSRGWFSETYCKKHFEDLGLKIDFVQDNQSLSQKVGTVRGLHLQQGPKAQTKLVRCTNGAIFDVAVDVRDKSPTYGSWFGIELSCENKKQLLIPKGFAHGFMTLSENTEVQYKCDEYYAPEYEVTLLWNDRDISIEWPSCYEAVLSKKDLDAISFENFTIRGKR